MGKDLQAEHGVVCRLAGERLGYFGWPTVARLADGTLWVASSGLRAEHVCPYGKTVVHHSHDDGVTWSPSRVIQDSMIDDRDAGIVDLGGGRLLVSWFRSDTRPYADASWLPAEERARWQEVIRAWTDAEVDALMGSWVMLSQDRGGTWSAPLRVPVSAPHGPIVRRDGSLLYLGKPFGTWQEMNDAAIAAAGSQDGGRTWQVLGAVPAAPRTSGPNYHEPHVVELPSGRLLGVIRIEDHSGCSLADAGLINFSMMQTESDDGGITWSVPRALGYPGSPPHLLRHSTGVLVLTYGYRGPTGGDHDPQDRRFGQRVALSYDDGASWTHDWVIRGDGPDGDLGYPSTVELADGRLFTVYYQKAAAGEKCSLLWSRWLLPCP